MLYFKLSSVPMRDVSNDSAPPTVNGKFTLSSQVHHYNTRSPSAGNFCRKYSRLNHHKNSFASVGAKKFGTVFQRKNFDQFNSYIIKYDLVANN